MDRNIYKALYKTGYVDKTRVPDELGEAERQAYGYTIEDAEKFIGKICPAASDEIGKYLNTGVWRQHNILRVAKKAERIYSNYTRTGIETAHLRLVCEIIDAGSWTDSYRLQEMWAGLLASSCTLSGKDESNLIFIRLMPQITALQARIIEIGCLNSEKYILRSGGIASKNYTINLYELEKTTGVADFHRLDRELDHLRSLSLILGGFGSWSTSAEITPTPLALHMFVRCRGFSGSPAEYFRVDKDASTTQKLLSVLRV